MITERREIEDIIKIDVKKWFFAVTNKTADVNILAKNIADKILDEKIREDAEMNKLQISFPVTYLESTQQIFDANNNLVADLRGWGRIQYFDNAIKLQNDIGEFIAKAMNEKFLKGGK